MGVPRLRARAAFLDRDGVLDQPIRDVRGALHPPQSVEELVILPNAPEGCDLLRALGYVLVIVTNQPDVARGTQQRTVVEELNRRVAGACGVEHVRVCYHDDPDPEGCRKPQPGLLTTAARELEIELARSVMIGDGWRDIEAGRRAGCRTVLIGRDLPSPYRADIRADDLLAAARQLAEEERSVR